MSIIKDGLAKTIGVGFPEPLSSLFSLEPAAVTNFFGSPGTGKTNICLILASICANSGGKVAYIDTEGGFSAERLKQIADGLRGGDLNNIVKSIIIIEPRNFEAQGKAVRDLEQADVDLVVLDSSVALYRLESAKGIDTAHLHKKSEPDYNGIDTAHLHKKSEPDYNGIDTAHLQDRSGPDYNSRKEKVNKFSTKDYYKTELSEHNRELSRQLSTLSNIARDKKIPVIITSHTYKNWDTGENEVVGGDALKYWSKSIVFLEKTGKTGERKATIIKHRSQPEGKAVKFLIVEDGIKPSGFKIF